MSVAVTLRRVFAGDDHRYLFGARTDVLAFGGPVILSGVLVGLGAATGILDAELSPMLWLLLVVGIDVAHVWSTIFRVYLDPAEVRRRMILYVGTPIAVYVLGIVLHGFSPLVFWRVVAYFAVWHFMRQQVGWLRLYHRRDLALTSTERRLDELLLWLVMLYPVAYWHAHLPRRFDWMLSGDFAAGLDPRIAVSLGVFTGLVTLVWIALQARTLVRGGAAPWGKWLLVGSTACAWYVGIVAFDSDYVFTVTNIPLHGIPYAVLTLRYGRARVTEANPRPLALALRGGLPAFLGLLWLIAFAEEVGWDRLVWHDHTQYFGSGARLDDELLALVVPLLALPQLTHYVLDGFVWKRAGNE